MKKVVVLLFLVVLLAGFVSADFDLGNVSYFLETSYAPGGLIKGWVNISFTDEPVDSILEDLEGNEISLMDLVKANPSYDKTCTTGACDNTYLASDGEATKSFSLGGTDSVIVGFEFSEEITDITSIEFNMESDAGSSCTNQIEIDILADGTVETGNSQASSSSCSHTKTYGCFDESATAQEYFVGSEPNMHCQRTTLTESPGFKLGAWVKRDLGSQPLKMALYTLNFVEVENVFCELDNSPGEGEISCNVDYLVTDAKEYYVCIYSEDEDTVSKIKGYSDSENGCGFYYTGSRNENYAYQIFAEGMRFDSVGILSITNDLGSAVNSFAENVKSYIITKYGDFKCSSSDPCIVPVLIKSGKSQEVILRDLSIMYQGLGGPSELTNFYSVEQVPDEINSDAQKLYLDAANFTVPEDYGEYEFELLIGGEEIFTEDVYVQNVPIIKSLKPLSTISAFPTPFEVSVNSSGNITKYVWNFGEGANVTTTKNTATHEYNSTGIYEVRVSVTDSLDLSSYKTFEVTVGSPESVINSSLKKMQTDLGKITSQILTLTAFHQTSVNLLLDTDNMENELKSLQTSYAGASTETEYNQIMSDILDLDVPESISVTTSTDAISFYSTEEIVDLDILKDVGGGDYDSSKKNSYINAVLAWNQKNLNTKVTFDEISATYEGGIEPILRVFEVDISEKTSLAQDPYFILADLENLKFKENYLESESSGYVVIELDGTKSPISFSTTEDVSFFDLPLFVAPALARLDVTTICQGDECESDSSSGKWALFILVLVLILILAAVVYIILQGWYKRKYENYLFKNQNNLFNLINYIENEKKKGTKEGAIISKLKKAGWSGEQIRYVMRKHSGKRTGMLFEIPVEKVMSKLRKKPVPIKRQVFQPRFGSPGNKKSFLRK